MMATTCIRIIQVALVVLLSVSDGDGQLLGHPAPRTLQEFLGVPQEFQEFPGARYGARHLTDGYGTPKPYVPIVKTVISDAAGASEHGGNTAEPGTFSGDIQGRSPDEFKFNEILTEHEDENNDRKNLGQDYQLLKESAVKGLNKNAYGFKHNPKKFRNPQEEEISKKSSDGSGRPFGDSSDGFSLRENTDSSAGFFSQPDWRDWPQDGAGRDGDHADQANHGDATDAGERGTGFPPGGHFREQYTVEVGHERPEGDGSAPELSRQSHVSRDRQQTLREFGAMVSIDSSRARGAEQDISHPVSNEQDTRRGHSVSREQDSYTDGQDSPLNDNPLRTESGPTEQQGGVARDFADHRQEFGRPKELTASAEFNSHSEPDSHRGVFAFDRVSGNSDYSSSEDTGRQPHSARDESHSSSDFASGRQQGGPSVSSAPGPSVSSYSSPAEDWRGEDGRVRDVSSFEPQRTTAQPKREGYNTPKPYRPPPQPQHLPPQTTTPPPWRGAGPLGRPQYGPELSAGPYGPFQDADAPYGLSQDADGPYGPSQDAAGLYSPSQHSLLGLSAARHAPGYDQPYRDVHGYTGYQRGYTGYRHGYQSTPLPYAAAVVHTDEHYHAVPVYPSGHEVRGTAGYAAGGYPSEYGSEYRAGYGRGTGDGRGHLQGVQLYQITQPVLPQYGAADDHRINAAPDHSEHVPSNYGTAGYGTAGYGTPGYGTPGYVSLEYVPAGHPGGYGLKRPAYSSVYYSTRDYGGHAYGYGSHGEYRVPEVSGHEGYKNRPYRRADEASGQQPAASEPVETLAAASEPKEPVTAASETVETVAANPESVKAVAELAKPLVVDVTPEGKI